MKLNPRSVGLALLCLLLLDGPLLGDPQAASSSAPAAAGQDAASRQAGGGAGAREQQTRPMASASVNANGAGAYHLTSQTQLVLIPALVRDRAGRHVPGLKAGDFTVKDNGKVHPVKLVEEITAPSAAALDLARLPPGTYSNDVVRSKAPLRVVIILFDMLNSHFKDQVPARIQLTKYLNDQVEPGTLVALLGLGRGGLRMYHDLTSDTKGLATELQMSMETGRHSISTNLQGEMSETESEAAFVGHGGFAQTGSSGRSSKKLIVLDTLAAFKDIAGAYASLPGRKSLVWVTGGFPFTLDDSKAGSHGMAGMDKDSLVDMIDDYRSTWQALNNANMALYPVDMHGLQDTAQPDATYRAKRGGNSSRSLGKFPSVKEDRNEDNIQTFTSFAGETGGKAFYNNNDLVSGFKEAVDDSRFSYLLGYYLDRDAKPGWHKLQVSVSRPGVHIRARAGFLVPKAGHGLTQAQTTASQGAAGPADSPQAAEVNLAMSSPMNYTAVPITVKWLDPSGMKLPVGRGADAGKRMVPFQIILPPNAVTLGANESKMSLNFVGLARSANGDDAANFVKKIDGTLKPDVARRLVLAGIKFDSMMMLAPGFYNVRFVVRDNVSEHIGSVTAPVVVK